MANIEQRNAELNDAIAQGRVLDVFPKYYADDVVMIENDEPTEGFEANFEREKQFFGAIQEFHAGGVTETAVSGKVSFAAMNFDVTMKDGNRMKMDEVSQRWWNDDGKIVRERFFYKG